MKKLIALLLALTLVFSMAACGSKGEDPRPRRQHCQHRDQRPLHRRYQQGGGNQPH